MPHNFARYKCMLYDVKSVMTCMPTERGGAAVTQSRTGYRLSCLMIRSLPQTHQANECFEILNALIIDQSSY